MCHGASSTFQLNGGEDTQAWLVLKAHQHQAQPSCCVPIQNTCCSKIRLITFARHYWRWTWWWLGHPGHEMLREGTTPSKKSVSQAERGWWYLVSTAADGKSPAVIKGVRISPSMYILLTLGQTKGCWIAWLLVCIQLPFVFNSFQYFLTVLRCTELLVAIDKLTNKITSKNFTGGWREARTLHKLLSQLHITFLRLI